MNPTAYIETSVVSYLTARPSRDVVVASALVIAKARVGDVDAARARLEALKDVAFLDATLDAEQLTQTLLEFGAVPRQASGDAAHIAIAVTNGVDYLVTWNFRHIANAAMRARIEYVCRRAGYEPPIICPPNELLETDHEDNTE